MSAPDRRRFLQTAGLGAAAVALGARPGAAAAARRPNVVVLLCDDMGFSDIGCYGGEIHTPNLDRLAAGGLRFSQFYNTARCCPTRACLLTGLYPHQAGVGHMIEDKGLEGYQGHLGSHCVTMAEVLGPAGYGTYAVGKWHVAQPGDAGRPNWPRQRGFQRYYGTIEGAGSYYDPGTLTRDNQAISPFADPDYRPERFYYTDAITDNAITFLDDHVRQKPEQPFFLYCAYTCAHWPLHALPEDIAKYQGVYDGGYEAMRRTRFVRCKELGLIHPEWDLSPTEGDWQSVEHKAWETRCMEVYAAMIDRMDQGVGRLTAALTRLGRLDDTLLLWLQDNGGCQESIGRDRGRPRPEHPTLPTIPPEAIRRDVIPRQNRAGIPTLTGPDNLPGGDETYISYGIGWANVSNTPFREYKHFVHEGGISTPLIAHWPAGIARRGEIEHQPGHLIDLATTIYELAGADYPKQRAGAEVRPLEGRSLTPAFSGGTIARDAIFWEHEGNRAIRQGNWKLVAKHPAGRWELYDLQRDRTEMHDLAAAEPQRLAAMTAAWEAFAKRTYAIPWPWQPPYGQAAGGTRHGRYALGAGADLEGNDAPAVAGQPLAITARLDAGGHDGVILAHGGSGRGYALYVKDGRLEFAVRHAERLVVVTSPQPLPAGPVQVEARLAVDGAMTLLIAGQALATGRCEGPLGSQPKEGLQVGRDLGTAVGRYEAPNPFGGSIASVELAVGD
jgi:arylsulfatase